MRLFYPKSVIRLWGDCPLVSSRNRMRTEAGKMPESLIFLTENSPGVSNDRFGFMAFYTVFCAGCRRL